MVAKTSLESRKKEEEAKFKHREDLEFRVLARRNKLLGLWAAEQLGYPPESAEAYAKEVVTCALGAPDRAHDKVNEELASNGVDVSGTRVRDEMSRLEDVAREQVIKEAREGNGSVPIYKNALRRELEPTLSPRDRADQKPVQR